MAQAGAPQPEVPVPGTPQAKQAAAAFVVSSSLRHRSLRLCSTFLPCQVFPGEGLHSSSLFNASSAAAASRRQHPALPPS